MEFDGKDGEKWKVVGKSYRINLNLNENGFNRKHLQALEVMVSALFVVFLTLIFDKISSQSNKFSKNNTSSCLLSQQEYRRLTVGAVEGRSWQRISANNLLPTILFTIVGERNTASLLQ